MALFVMIWAVVGKTAVADPREGDANNLTNSGLIQFQDVTEEAGISYMGPSFGASWGDFNDDSHPDLWVNNHASQPSLYLNQEDGTFIDIAADVWSASPGADTHGAAWADFDNDGDQDLVELVGAQHGVGEGANHVFLNDEGVLIEQAAELGLTFPGGRGRTPLWLDWDQDGWLDLMLSNLSRPDGEFPSVMFQQNGDVFREANVGFEAANHSEFGQLADLSGDGKLDLVVHGNPFPQRIYDMSSVPFSDLTNTLEMPDSGWTQDAIIGDFDGDLHSDLYILRLQNVSDFAQINDDIALALFVLRREENGFSVQTAGDVLFFLDERRLEASHIYIGADGHHPPTCCSFLLSPYDPTVLGIKEHEPGSDPGIYIGYDAPTETWRVLASSPGAYTEVTAAIHTTSPISASAAIGFEPPARPLYDRLLLHNEGAFIDQTLEAGLDAETECPSGVTGDFDNDMDLDIYLVCSRPVMNVPNLLYENQNDGTFAAVSDAGGATGSVVGIGESVAAADYDSDGFLDLFVTNGDAHPPFPNGPYQLFRNVGNGNHWLELDLVGTVSNRDGIGARILVTAGGVTQLREQNGGMHNRSQNHQRIHFGLGENTTVDRILIQWPSGSLQSLRNVAADQVLPVVELPPRFFYLPIVTQALVSD